jgi:hypothetical protein
VNWSDTRQRETWNFAQAVAFVGWPDPSFPQSVMRKAMPRISTSESAAAETKGASTPPCESRGALSSQ